MLKNGMNNRFVHNDVNQWGSVPPVLWSGFPINLKNSFYGTGPAFCKPNADGIVFGIENTFPCTYWQVSNGCLHYPRGRNEMVIGHI